MLLNLTPGKEQDLDTHIGFSTSTSTLSALIRKVTNSKISHCWFLYYDPAFEMQVVMEASAFGFRVIPYEEFKKHNKIWYVIKPKVNIDKGISKVAKYLGSMYDFKGLFGMLFVMFGRWLKIAIKNPFRSNSWVYCTESVSRALEEIKYPGWEGKDHEAVAPEDLVSFLKQ